MKVFVKKMFVLGVDFFTKIQRPEPRERSMARSEHTKIPSSVKDRQSKAKIQTANVEIVVPYITGITG